MSSTMGGHSLRARTRPDQNEKMSFSLPEKLGLPDGAVPHQQLVVAGCVLGLTVISGVAWWYHGTCRKTSKPVFRPVGKLSDIWIHPIKSCRGHQVSSADCTPTGLLSHGVRDRHFIVLSDRGTFVTLRQEPSLALLQPRILEDGQHLTLEAPGMDPLTISLTDITDSEKHFIEFRIWKMNVDGLDCGQEAEAWLSSYLKKPAHKLVFFKAGLTKARKLIGNAQWGTKFTSKDETYGFQDLTPLMLMTEASMVDLNTRLERPVTMRNTRPNLVVSGTKPYDEDLWKYVRIGDTVTLRRTYGCGRCKLTTVDPETGVVRTDGEPLATLRQYRMLDKSDPDSKSQGSAPVFGSNMVCDVFGTVNVGDTVYAAVY